MNRSMRTRRRHITVPPGISAFFITTLIPSLMAKPRRPETKASAGQPRHGVDLFVRPHRVTNAVVDEDAEDKHAEDTGRMVSFPTIVPLALAAMDVVLVGVACWLIVGTPMTNSSLSLLPSAVLMICAAVSGVLATWIFRR